MLRIGATEHDVGEQVDGSRQVLTHHRGIVDRVLFVGKSIQVAAHGLQAVQYLQGVAAVRTLEGDMFAEVGQSLLAWLFVA